MADDWNAGVANADASLAKAMTTNPAVMADVTFIFNSTDYVLEDIHHYYSLLMLLAFRIHLRPPMVHAWLVHVKTEKK